jgi:uncharacterized protein (TIGR03435 family)
MQNPAKTSYFIQTIVRKAALTLPFLAGLSTPTIKAQSTFDVATIRPSSAEVKFERNGKTEFAYGTLIMRDVTVSTCIQLAYGIPQPLIQGPESLKKTHFDITAKAAPDTTPQQMHLMLQSLLADRFKLSFHREQKELRVYTLIVAKSGIKMHPSAPGGIMSHENSATGMVAHSITMKELADYLSDPLDAPLTDQTNLSGPYDFTIDFTPYVDMERTNEHPDPVAVIKAALKGDLGLDLVQRKDQVNLLVVDTIQPPSGN